MCQNRIWVNINAGLEILSAGSEPNMCLSGHKFGLYASSPIGAAVFVTGHDSIWLLIEYCLIATS
jgi:hypothetical protein